MRRPARSFPGVVRAVAFVALSGCGVQPATDAGGADPTLAREAVCERYITVIGERGGISRSADSTGVTSPPEAEQHLRSAEALEEFGRWAVAADEPTIADSAARISAEAARVRAQLSPGDSDRRATRITRPLYEQTAGLYYDCMAEAYREVLRGDRPLTGACAEPGAPTLEGPNVIVYGSAGQDFIESTCELVHGEKVGNGCGTSSGGAAIAPGEGPIASVEVAYDPDTCRTLVETGQVPPGG